MTPPAPTGPQARPRAGRSARPIGGVREANSREIKMVPLARLELALPKKTDFECILFIIFWLQILDFI